MSLLKGTPHNRLPLKEGSTQGCSPAWGHHRGGLGRYATPSFPIPTLQGFLETQDRAESLGKKPEPTPVVPRVAGEGTLRRGKGKEAAARVRR